MRHLVFLFVIILSGNFDSLAQKTIEKQYSSNGIKALSIVDDAIFKVAVVSSPEKTIRLIAHFSGEHAESLVLEEKEFGGTLFLKTAFVPYFKPDNDKLSVHKLMAIEMELVVPETLSVEIISKLASVSFTGTVHNLWVSLENGNCELRNFQGNARLKTTKGAIQILALPTVHGEAHSIAGRVENNLGEKGKFFIEAESVSGNISMHQTE
ncbi:hypothetical protein F3C99_12320 [Vitellibacter sp. q18]|nr:hypothetical protein [Aequorivita lutea]